MKKRNVLVFVFLAIFLNGIYSQQISGIDFPNISVDDLLLAIKNGFDVNDIDEKGNTLIFYAIDYNIEAIPVLIAAGADLNAVNNDGNTVLHEVQNCYPLDSDMKIAFELLLNSGANPNLKNKEGENSFLRGVRRPQDTDVLDMLVAAKADIFAPNNKEENALSIAASGESAEMVEYLIGLGVKVPDEDKNAIMTEVMAFMYGDQVPADTATRIGSLLLSAGAKINAKNESGITGLMLAAQWTDAQYIEMLLKSGADPEIRNQDGRTSLMLAISSGWNNLDVIKLLIKYGARIDGVDNNGDSLLHLAATSNKESTDALIYLISSGVSVNSINKNGYSPIMVWAEQSSNIEVLRVLTLNGGLGSIKGNDGLTALEIVKNNRSVDISAAINILRKLK
jgi:ankyrin repeat protein